MIILQRITILLAHFSYVVAFIFTACSTNNFTLDDSLPVVNNIKTITGINEVSFEWDYLGDKNIDSFIVFRKEISDKNDHKFKKIKEINNPIKSHFVDDSLKQNTQYSYYFQTKFENFVSPKSQTIDIKTLTLSPPELIYASKGLLKQIKLLWNLDPNPTIKGYGIERLHNNTFKTVTEVSNRLTLEYIDESLDDEESYTYRIYSFDYKDNKSPASNEIKGTTRDKPKLDIKVLASKGEIKRIKLSWNNSSLKTLKRYKVYRAKTIDSNYTLIDTTKNNFYIDEVPDETTYFYRVSIVDIFNVESRLSDVVMGKSKELPKEPILKEVKLIDNVIHITWKSTYNNFILFKKKGFFGSLEEFKIDSKTFVDNNINVNNTYYYYVKALEEDLISLPSNEISIDVNNASR